MNAALQTPHLTAFHQRERKKPSLDPRTTLIGESLQNEDQEAHSQGKIKEEDEDDKKYVFKDALEDDKEHALKDEIKEEDDKKYVFKDEIEEDEALEHNDHPQDKAL
ncbi:hypothetical protein N7519_005285 [Penicillium mononematosum]|uniref:uncharacterized protein n=1 Tax=Penicillium mononematosum TaxID=268346 RepID=UPI0025499517|nr:uncharacterized protein N7519_005285 [Penicillium mononematosum]KAJ6183984.1 hypothetical protein N7519_005285 [Penicillium mononematosum]